MMSPFNGRASVRSYVVSTENGIPRRRAGQASIFGMTTPDDASSRHLGLWSGVGIVVSLPGGVVLALARRSRMPVIRAVTIAYIELVS